MSTIRRIKSRIFPHRIEKEKLRSCERPLYEFATKDIRELGIYRALTHGVRGRALGPLTEAVRYQQERLEALAEGVMGIAEMYGAHRELFAQYIANTANVIEGTWMLETMTHDQVVVDSQLRVRLYGERGMGDLRKIENKATSLASAILFLREDLSRTYSGQCTGERYQPLQNLLKSKIPPLQKRSLEMLEDAIAWREWGEQATDRLNEIRENSLDRLLA